MSIGHSPDTESHKPDMKKDESSITAEERQDAQRRIEGSINPDMEGGDFYHGLAGPSEGVSSMDAAHIQ
jgi:hypothetical protein